MMINYLFSKYNKENKREEVVTRNFALLVILRKLDFTIEIQPVVNVGG